MAKIDNGEGAESAFHVSPTVAATKFAAAEGAHDIIDSMEGGVLPPASGDEGTPELRQTDAVGADKLEH